MFRLLYRLQLSDLLQKARYVGLILIPFVFLSACSNVRPVEETVVAPEVVIKSAPVKKPAVPEIIKPLDVSVLLSSKAATYENIASKLKAGEGYKVTKYVMSGYDNRDAVLLNTIQESSNRQVVAIGLRAAKSAKYLEHKQVVFCQVFDHKNEQLVAENMKGISVLPSAEKLFTDWKLIDPGLRKVALITGPDLDEYVDSAKQAARKKGINLLHQVVSTDKEYLYTSKNLPLDVQGFWLLPDNRVLSLQVLKDVLAFNAKEGRQIVVFNKELLSYGGLMSTEPDIGEIALLVKKRLKDSAGFDHVPGDDVLLLNEHLLSINSKVAKQLGLDVPAGLREKIYD